VFNEESLEAGEGHRFLDEVLCRVQDELFDIGSELATPPEFFQAGMYQVGDDEIKRLEKLIDQCQEISSRSIVHLAGRRARRRLSASIAYSLPRAEREILRLSRAEEINPRVIKYINRLSDLFFVLSRWIAKQTGQTEYLWQRGLQQKPRKGEISGTVI